MPYCEVLTTTKIGKPEEKALDREIARIIELVPGKSERWVMVHIEDQARMSFAGSCEEPAAMVTLKTFGELEPEMYDLLTQEFCARLSERLHVPRDRIYVVYEPIAYWGWDGKNF